MRREIVCGLDMGTTKICASLGEFVGDNKFRLLGKARLAAEGLERGKVLDMDKLTTTIERIMHLVQLDSGLSPNRLILGWGTDDFMIQHYRQTLSISERPREIKEQDIDKLMDKALEMSQPFDHEIIHTFPQEFFVDGQDKIKDPKGMFGSKISVRLLIISAPVGLVYNLKKCVYNAGYDIDGLAFSGLASSLAFLTEEERRSGVIFLEIGGGLTSVIKFVEDTPVFLEIIPFGGIDIDVIIASALDIPLSEAKELKEEYGSLNRGHLNHKIILKDQETKLTQTKLRKLMTHPIERTLLQIKRRLDNSHHLNYVPRGIVLGGGLFFLDGMVEKVEEIFRLPVRLGAIRNLEDRTQDTQSLFLQATSIGLIYLDLFKRNQESTNQVEMNPLQRLVKKTQKIFGEYF